MHTSNPLAWDNTAQHLFKYGIIFGTLFLLCILPFIFHRSYAQTSLSGGDNLSATIQNAIQTDPRAADLSQEQIIAIVHDLTQKAQSQGMTTHDLLWRPTLAHNSIASNAIADAQGDYGPGVTSLILLGVAAAIILAIIAGWLEIRHWRRTRIQMEAK